MQKLEQQNATTNPMHAANSHPYNNTIPSAFEQKSHIKLPTIFCQKYASVA